MVRHIALISETPLVGDSELSSVAAAIQKQVARDFGPIWEIDATVDAFPRLEDVPPGYWIVSVRTDLESTQGVKGAHYDDANQPFALVQYTGAETWPIMASHECLEMLGDPSLNKLVASASLKPDQGRVEYLLEVCDPCQDPSFAYSVNGIRLSDFYTQNYFDPIPATAVRYSFGGAITAPRQLLEGGYVSWRDPETAEWWQAVMLAGQLQFINRGPKNAALPAREFIDSIDPFPVERAARTAMSAAAYVHADVHRASVARASALRARVAGLFRAGRSTLAAERTRRVSRRKRHQKARRPAR